MASNPIRWVLPLSSVVIIAVGAGIAIAGETTLGIIIAAVGVVDLAAAPLVLRAIGRARTVDSGSTPPPADPAADPSYNPYARED